MIDYANVVPYLLMFKVYGIFGASRIDFTYSFRSEVFEQIQYTELVFCLDLIYAFEYCDVNKWNTKSLLQSRHVRRPTPTGHKRIHLEFL